MPGMGQRLSKENKEVGLLLSVLVGEGGGQDDLLTTDLKEHLPV